MKILFLCKAIPLNLQREAGAPVVLNAVLWGIVSSWRPVDCENDLAGPSFVSLVSAPNISSWIYATTRGQSWKKLRYNTLKSLS